MKKGVRESTPLQSRVAMDVWNAWRRRKVGGFTCAGARSAGISVAATVPLASMHPGMRQNRASDHRQLRAG